MRITSFTVTLIGSLTKVLRLGFETFFSAVLEVLVPDAGVLMLGGTISIPFNCVLGILSQSAKRGSLIRHN